MLIDFWRAQPVQKPSQREDVNDKFAGKILRTFRYRTWPELALPILLWMSGATSWSYIR